MKRYAFLAFALAMSLNLSIADACTTVLECAVDAVDAAAAAEARISRVQEALNKRIDDVEKSSVQYNDSVHFLMEEQGAPSRYFEWNGGISAAGRKINAGEIKIERP